MKKASMKMVDQDIPELKRDELGKGVRGKYLKHFTQGSNVVVLQPEIQKAFPTSEAVNKALASMLAFAQETRGLTGRASRTARKLVKTSHYDVAEHLRNPEEMVAYLDAWLEEAPEDVAGIARALGDIARAKGMSQVAKDAGLSRESLYSSTTNHRRVTSTTSDQNLWNKHRRQIRDYDCHDFPLF